MMKIRILAAVFLLSLSCTAYAQKSMFVRVYDLSGKQINKGHVTMATDTSLQLKANPIPVNIPVGSIGYIKTGRSGLRNVLFGSIVGGVAGAIALHAYATKNRGIAIPIGVVVGGIPGAALGGLSIPLTAVFKKTYLIEGNPAKWQEFESVVKHKMTEQ